MSLQQEYFAVLEKLNEAIRRAQTAENNIQQWQSRLARAQSNNDQQAAALARERIEFNQEQLRFWQDQVTTLTPQVDQALALYEAELEQSQSRNRSLVEPPPGQSASQQAQSQTGTGPTQPPPAVTPGPTNAEPVNTQREDPDPAPTVSLDQTQTVGSPSAARVIPTETGAQLPPPETLPGTANTSGTGAATPGAFQREDSGTPVTPSSQTKPPTITANLSADGTITPQDNVLDQYANYTYEASVYLMSDEQYRTYVKTGRRTVNGYNLLFQTGGAPENQGGSPTSTPQNPAAAGAPSQPSSTVGRNPNFPLDYYIDSISFQNYLPGKSTQSAHSISELRFTVIEPANITLIDNIFRAVQEIKPRNAVGAVNYAAAHFLMIIRFYGYDQQGRIQRVGVVDPKTGLSDPNALIEKFIPFKIKDINWSVSNRLVTYEFTCATTDQILAAGTRRGSVPADIELSGGTVKEILSSGVIYSGTASTPDTPGASTTPSVDQSDAETARLNRQAGGGAPTAPAAPAKATAAPSKTAVKQGLMAMMNQLQQQLVKDGVYEVADQYAIEFAPGAESIADATITKPGNKISKAQTSVGAAPSQQPSVALPGKQSMIAQTRNQTVVAGMQIIQCIDLVIRNSNYITQQATINVEEDTNQSDPNERSRSKGVNWYNVTFRAEPLEYDNKRNDFAYKITYIINVFPVQDFLSVYFPTPIFRGIHKRYPYWFTGINTSVLDYTATFNKLYHVTVSTNSPTVDNLAEFRKKYTSNMRDMAFFQYQASSTESRQFAYGKTNEVAANAAEYLYNPSDNGRARLRILGDPAWISQGAYSGGISAENFSYSPFLPDGTINFDSNDVLFEILWQRPEDYDLQTGLADPYQRTSRLYGDRQPRQSVVYRATTVETELHQGRFEQTLNGTLYLFPLPDGSNAVSPVYRGTQTEGNEGEEQARQNYARQQAQQNQSNRNNAAPPAAVSDPANGAAAARGVTDGAADRVTDAASLPGLSDAARLTAYGKPGARSAPGQPSLNLLGIAGQDQQAPGAGIATLLPTKPPAGPSSNGANVGLAQRDIDEATRIQQESGDPEAITPQQVANNRLINERLSSVFGTVRAPQTISRET